MSDFNIHQRNANGVVVLDLKGELDAHTASELETALERCLEQENPDILVNGENLDYISSAGLGVFMAYIEDIRDSGGDLKIAALKPKVYNVFDLLGFPMLFDIHDTEQEALNQFAEPTDTEPAEESGN